MSKFTPGPWCIGDYPFEILQKETRLDVASVEVDTNPNMKADACLIAKAPEMYKELRRLIAMGVGTAQTHALLAEIDGGDDE